MQTLEHKKNPTAQAMDLETRGLTSVPSRPVLPFPPPPPTSESWSCQITAASLLAETAGATVRCLFLLTFGPSSGTTSADRSPTSNFHLTSGVAGPLRLPPATALPEKTALRIRRRRGFLAAAGYEGSGLWAKALADRQGLAPAADRAIGPMISGESPAALGAGFRERKRAENEEFLERGTVHDRSN